MIAEYSTDNETRLPTMVCFIPSLECGRSFKVSIHSWVNHPKGSPFAIAMCKDHGLVVKFEARVFINGNLVACVSVNPSCLDAALRKQPYELDGLISAQVPLFLGITRKRLGTVRILLAMI